MLTKQTDARGVSIQFTYDAMGRLLRKDYTTPAGMDPMSSAVYTYDAAGVPFSVGKLTHDDRRQRNDGVHLRLHEPRDQGIADGGRNHSTTCKARTTSWGG